MDDRTNFAPKVEEKMKESYAVDDRTNFTPKFEEKMKALIEEKEIATNADTNAIQALVASLDEPDPDVVLETVEETPKAQIEAVQSVDSSLIPIMRCGHIANSAKLFRHKGTGQFYREFSCVLCLELVPMCRSVLGPDGRPIIIQRKDLAGRQARCSCKKKIPSDQNGVTFLLHQPHKSLDRWYCGHSGYDPRFVKRQMMSDSDRIRAKAGLRPVKNDPEPPKSA